MTKKARINLVLTMVLSLIISPRVFAADDKTDKNDKSSPWVAAGEIAGGAAIHLKKVDKTVFLDKLEPGILNKEENAAQAKKLSRLYASEAGDLRVGMAVFYDRPAQSHVNRYVHLLNESNEWHQIAVTERAEFKASYKQALEKLKRPENSAIKRAAIYNNVLLPMAEVALFGAGAYQTHKLMKENETPAAITPGQTSGELRAQSGVITKPASTATAGSTRVIANEASSVASAAH